MAHNTPRKRQAYMREYYARKKVEDPEWFAKRRQQVIDGNKRRYHERQHEVFKKHANELAKMTIQEDITKYLEQYFKLRGDKK